MKFKVTFESMDAEQMAGIKPYGNEEKPFEIVEANDAGEAITAMKWHIEESETDNGFQLSDSLKADAVIADDDGNIVRGYYNFTAEEIND